MMYGLPMSLHAEDISEMKDATITSFNGQESYQITIKLKEGLISKYWRLYLATADYHLLGLEIFDPKEEGGEKIVLDGEMEYKGLLLPRMRHWYELDGKTYSGSDIIVKELN